MRIKPEIKNHARSLRCRMTEAEHNLWQALRKKQLNGYRFRRQHPIGPYIADFACIDKKCLIELDGGQHQDQVDYDTRRTLFLERQGWQVLRYWNNEVLNNLDGVLINLAERLDSTSGPPS